MDKFDRAILVIVGILMLASTISSIVHTMKKQEYIEALSEVALELEEQRTELIEIILEGGAE